MRCCMYKRICDFCLFVCVSVCVSLCVAAHSHATAELLMVVCAQLSAKDCLATFVQLVYWVCVCVCVCVCVSICE